MTGEQFGARQLQYEWFYAGDAYLTRQRFFQSPATAEYKEIVSGLLHSRKL
jgi:4-hydroxyphenylacetate 3-hydroxylase C terminal